MDWIAVKKVANTICNIALATFFHLVFYLDNVPNIRKKYGDNYDIQATKNSLLIDVVNSPL